MSTNTALKESPLLVVADLGQSIWLDSLDRSLIRGGRLADLIEEGLSGVTSNPAIFEKALLHQPEYEEDFRRLIAEGRSAAEIYRLLTVQDIQEAADVLRAVYDRTDGRDGFVSLEVSPHLARDAKATLEEARELWRLLDRPNVFIKVPATREGLEAVRQGIAEGINVNVTLLFGLERYAQVAEAYLGGLHDRVERNLPLRGVASVASFFLSRIDTMLDPLLRDRQDARELAGRTAIASAKVAYQMYKELFGGPRFAELRDRGARPQRLLWASTSTKDPRYSDVKYVEALIGPETVNTLPTETLNAFRDHGRAETHLEEGAGEACRLLAAVEELGIRLSVVSHRLEEEGIEKFIKPYDSVMDVLRKKGAKG